MALIADKSARDHECCKLFETSGNQIPNTNAIQFVKYFYLANLTSDRNATVS